MSADTRNSLRRVQFPEAGEGVELLLPNSGTRLLFNEYGEGYFQAIEKGLLFGDIQVIEKCLSLMGHKGGEKFEIKFDDLDHIPLQQLMDKLLDAFSLSANGRTYIDQVKHVQEQIAKANESPDPSPGGPADTSELSSDEPSARA